MSSLTARDLTKMALLVALLFVAAFIAVPLPFTPAMITMTTLVFNLTAFLLPPKQALIVCVVYTLCGAAGLPVHRSRCVTFHSGRYFKNHCRRFHCLEDSSIRCEKFILSTAAVR